MKPIRTVFDTNVYLAAVKTNSYACTHLKRSRPNGLYRLFVSPEIILEIQDRLEVKFGFARKESAKFIEMIMSYAVLVQPKQRITGVLKDADDHKILECALEAKAEIIVSADRGLLQLKEYEGTRIIHPSMLKYWQ